MDIQDNLLANLKKIYLKDLLNRYDKNEAEQLLTILIEHFFSITRIQLIMKPNLRISESEILKLHMAVKELKKYKPIQYITGAAEFHDLKLKVNPDVLIPRPETEELVQLINNIEKAKNLKVLDIGTGSGCIAISISILLNSANVHASDISESAIKVAQNNAIINNVEVNFHNHDIFDIKQSICKKNGNPIMFDIIISNPPYVTQNDKTKMQSNVIDYEPHNALFVSNKKPLVYYDAIIQFAKKQLVSGGRIYFEINESLGNQMVALLEKHNFINVELKKDLSGRDRFVFGVNPFL